MARILLIDDDEVLLSTMSRILTKAGHRVASARDGTDGVELFRGEHADIVLTDLVMPHNGLHGIKELRAEFPDLVIIAMSGDDDRLEQAVPAGAYHVLRKPFTAEELTKAIEEALV